MGVLTKERALTNEQAQAYERDGYLILRDQFEVSELDRFERALQRHPPEHGIVPGVYPAPGRYTLANSCMSDPDLGFMAEHPRIVPLAGQLLDDDPMLTAFVVYDRTPGGPGIPMHHDYKRWRPVGSSMKWLFTIVPLCDFDEEAGQLFVAPGSHRLDRVKDRGEPVLHVDPAVRPNDDEFIDPGLKRGDLLLMNMHLWHKASPNKSSKSRVGIFNKYAARHCPPATGYYVFTDAAKQVLSSEGQAVIAVASDAPVATTRALLERESAGGQPEYLVASGAQGACLPGGTVMQEQAIPDWDHGNYIASLQHHLREQLRMETPWLTYVGDYGEPDPRTPGLTRIYAYRFNGNGFPVALDSDCRWVDGEELSSLGGFLGQAAASWQDPAIIRGKGVTQAQARVDQFAY